MEHAAMEQVRPTQTKEKKRLPVDEHLIVPHQRAELVCGELVMTPPAGEPHGRKHVELGSLLSAHVGGGYLVALDMLTRVSEGSDFAPDASVYPEARDAEGHRQLEVMAFEIVSQQRRSVATSKARELAARGVRRIFCIDLNTREILEWRRDWVALDEAFEIEDVCLASPIRVSALWSATEGDEAVAKALHRRGNAYIEQLLEDSHDAGEVAGRLAELRRSITRLVERSSELPESLRVALEACGDIEHLDQCMEIALSTGDEEVLEALSAHLTRVP